MTDDIFEDDKKDEELEKASDSDIVRGVIDQVNDPSLKEMLTGWLGDNVDKEAEIAEEGGGTDVIDEIAEEIGEKVEDVVAEVLGGGGGEETVSEPEPEVPGMEKSDDDDEDEEDDLEKCSGSDKDLEKSDDDDEDDEDEPAVEKSWRVPLFKSEEEQVVYGVVLEPGTEDLQGDIVAAADVRKACHEFMMKSQRIGHEHEGSVNAQIVENYIAPLDFDCGGQRVKKGSWIMVTKIHDPNIWNAVKTGEITGYSIGGSGTRIPV